MNWIEKYITVLPGGQKGISLIETVIALGILGFIAVAFLNGLSAISRNADLYEQRVTAQCLAQSQLEEIKAMAYDPNASTSPYPVEVTLPTNYSMSVTVVEQVTNKQQITIDISRGGRHILQLATIKANW